MTDYSVRLEVGWKPCDKPVDGRRRTPASAESHTTMSADTWDSHCHSSFVTDLYPPFSSGV